jgi:hypothetical protein
MLIAIFCKIIYTKRFNDIVNLFQLTQLINHPTRITVGTSSLLDVAVVSISENILQSGVLHVGIGDHQCCRSGGSLGGGAPLLQALGAEPPFYFRKSRIY